MIIALVSLNQKWEDKSANLLSCETLIKRAKRFQADLVIFPEMTLTGFSMNTAEIAEKFGESESVEAFRALAREYGLGIIVGIVLKKNTKPGNYAVFIDKSGEIACTYQKIHPFSFAGESDHFEAGREITRVDFESMNLGLTICYDLRFPELYSALGTNSDLIVNIANWPAKRRHHWDILLRARAIENQIFIVGVNRTGKDIAGLVFAKSSQIIGPNGENVEPIYSEEEIDIFEMNKEFTHNFKLGFSTVRDRNPEFYKSIL
jgi:omega-amidase